MREGKSATPGTIHKAAILTVFTLLLITAGAAFDVTFNTPQAGDIIHDDQWFNISVPAEANVTNVNITYDQSDGEQFTDSLATLYNESQGQDAFTTENDTTVFDDGMLWLNASAINQTGHRDSTVIQVNVSNEAPTITLEHPDGEDAVSGDVWVNATATDTGSSVELFQYRWVNETGDAETDWISLLDGNDLFDTEDTGGVPEGTYDLEFRANDTVGNLAEDTIVDVLVDNTDPNATDALEFNASNQSAFLNSDVADAVLGSTTVGLNWSGQNMSTDFTDDRPEGYEQTELMVQDRPFNVTTGEFGTWSEWESRGTVEADDNETTVTLDSGYEHNIKLRAVDTAGNYDDSNTVTVAIDTDAPEFAMNDAGDKQVTPLEWTNEEDPRIMANITDVVGMDNASIAMTISDGNGWEESLNLSTLGGTNASWYEVKTDAENNTLNLSHEEGYTVTVEATDRFGNVMEDSWMFETDLEPPESVELTEVMIAEANYTDDDNHTWYKGHHMVQVTCTDGVSGPDAVAAFVGDYKEFGWNESLVGENDEYTGSLTIDDHGQEEYTFKCRDKAGNINESQLTVSVDRRAPSLEESTVEDGDTGLNQEFSFQANFSDDAGLDTGASDVTLVTGVEQDGSISGLSWSSSDMSVSFDVVDLDPEESYEIKLDLVDNVGNDDTETIGFRTGESDEEEDEVTGLGGGGSGADLLDFYDVPSSLSVSQGEVTEFDMELINRADVALTGITINMFALGGPVFTPSDDGFSIENNTIEDVSVEVDASTTPADNYYPMMYVETDEDIIISHEMLVEVEATEPDLSISGPEEVDVIAGEETNITFTVSNSGGDANDLSVEYVLDALDVELVDTVGSITAGDEKTVTLQVVAAENVSLEQYAGTLTVSYGDETVEHDFAVRVQPGDQGEREAIAYQIDLLEERLETGSFDEDEKRMLESMVREARHALDDGDYVSAAAARDDIEESFGIEVSDATPTSIPIMPIAAVLLFTVIIATVGYGVIARQEQLEELLDTTTDGYSFQDAGGSQFVNTMKEHAAGLVAAVNDAAEKVKHLEVSIEKPELFSRGSQSDSPPSYTPQQASAVRSLDASTVRKRIETWFDAVSEQAYPYSLFEYLSKGAELDIREKFEEKRPEYPFARGQ